MIKNALWLFCLSVVIVVFFMPSYFRLVELREKNADYEQQIIQLKKENKELVLENRKLESDPAYLEKVAREKMGLVRDGEVVYKIVPGKAQGEAK